MSVTTTHATSMNDQSALNEALRTLGFQPEILAEAKKIRGHGSEMSRQQCDIVLKKEDTKRGADIGFARVGNGNYEIVTDTWVNSDLRMEEFGAQIKVEYTKVQSRRAAKKAGATFIGQRTNSKGEIVMRFARASA